MAPQASALAWDRISTYLATQGFAPARDVAPRQFAGGLANLNFLVRVSGENMVLRRPPGGPLPKGAHDMAREHRILSRLSQALAFVPRGLHLCTDLDVIGVPFQLIEYREGMVLRGGDWNFQGRELQMTKLLVETLAELHGVEAAAVGLDTLGRPEGFFARAAAGWRDRGRRVAETQGEQGLVEEIGLWLMAQHVREDEASLLHCDFKLDNCILDPASLRPRAVVDWDMGTRGPPLFDLATLLSYWTRPGDPPAMQALQQMPTAAVGFPEREEVVALYAHLTGRDVSDYPIFRVLAIFKLAVVFLQLNRNWARGAIGDARYAGFRELGLGLLDYAHAISRGSLS